MEENRKQKPRDFKDSNDDQERLSFQLNSIRDRQPIDSQKIMRELRKLRLMQVILYPLIIFGIIAIVIFILQGINLLIIAFNIIIVAIYLISLKYIYALRKTLKITKKDSKRFTKLEKKSKELSWHQIFFSLITLFLMIILIIELQPIILLIIIGITTIFVFLDTELLED